MEKGERLQYACGHWLVAGEYGIKDDSVKDVPTKRCGNCQRRLQDAAPQLLEALRWIQVNSRTIRHARAVATEAIDSAVRNRDPVE